MNTRGTRTPALAVAGGGAAGDGAGPGSPPPHHTTTRPNPRDPDKLVGFPVCFHRKTGRSLYRDKLFLILRLLENTGFLTHQPATTLEHQR